RRHTRFSRDWSSDVCSSDLAVRIASSIEPLAPFATHDVEAVERPEEAVRAADIEIDPLDVIGRKGLSRWRRREAVDRAVLVAGRSEERRVGKEGRSAGALGY